MKNLIYMKEKKFGLFTKPEIVLVKKNESYCWSQDNTLIY